MSLRFRLAHYEITDELGRGGMGVVYRATDTVLGRELAIKVLPSLLRADPERRGRFLREARAAAALNHPSIATVYEVGDAALEPVPMPGEDVTLAEPSECLYIAMELVPGEDLHDRLARGPVPLGEAIDIGVQVVSGLDCAHKAGVIHRDLKPRNIRLTPEGRVKILDFGLAKMLQEESPLTALGGPGEIRTMDGMIVGTVPYMAPEQVEGKDVDARSDLFAFGVVIYQMITGSPPYAGPNLVQYVRNLAKQRPEPLSDACPEVPPALVKIVDRLLARDSGERYAAADLVLEDLREILGTGSQRFQAGRAAVQEAPPVAAGEPPRRSFRRPLIFSGLFLAIVVVVASFRMLMGPDVDRASPFDATKIGIDPFVDLSGGDEGSGWCAESRAEIRRFLAQENPSLSILESATSSSNGLRVQGECLREEEIDKLNVSVRLASTEELIWNETFAPRGGITSRIDAEIAFVLARSVRFLSSFAELSSIEPDRRFAAAKYFLRGQRRVETALDGAGYSEGLRNLERSLEEAPDVPATHALIQESLWRGWRYFSPEFASRRQEEAATAVALDPDDFEARLARSRALLDARDPDASEQELLLLQRDWPENARVLHHLAWTYRRQGELEQAREYFFRAVRYRPGFGRYWNDLASLLLNLDWDAARDVLEEAVDVSPLDAIWPVENLAGLELDLGNLDRADALLSAVPEVMQTASFPNGLGRLHFYRRDWSAARQQFARAARNAPRNYLFSENLGDALWKLGDRIEARQRYETSLRTYQDEMVRRGFELGSEEPSALRAVRAQLLAKLDRCPRALTDVDLALTDDTRVLTRWDFLALGGALTLCGEPDRAEAMLDRARAGGLSDLELEVAVALEGRSG